MEYLITDTETAGLEPPRRPASGVCEIAWLEIDENLNLLGEGCHRVNPGCPIQEDASKINGIYDADVADKPKLEDVFQVKGPTVNIGHNAQFDEKFHGYCFENMVGSLCTLALSRQYIKGTANHKLQTLREALQLRHSGPAHTALGDCYTTLALLRHIVDKTGRGLPTLVAAARKPKIIHSMPFGKYRGQLIGELPTWYIEWFKDKEIDPDLRYSFDAQLKVRN